MAGGGKLGKAACRAGGPGPERARPASSGHERVSRFAHQPSCSPSRLPQNLSVLVVYPVYERILTECASPRRELSRAVRRQLFRAGSAVSPQPRSRTTLLSSAEVRNPLSMYAM